MGMTSVMQDIALMTYGRSSGMGMALVTPEFTSLISGMSVALEVFSLISKQSLREGLACMASEAILLASGKSMT